MMMMPDRRKKMSEPEVWIWILNLKFESRSTGSMWL